jgi:uncharacterized protein YecE (DUF72 family)
MASLFSGTSGWAYTSWRPGFYPEKLATTKFLPHYASRLNTVEVNYTFRHRLTDKVVAKWVKETPEHFRFGVKAHQLITHIKRLKGVEDLVQQFIDSLRPLAEARRLGPVLFQLEPKFKADLALLDSFLALLPRAPELCYAFEFRNESWFADTVYDALKRRGAAICVAESEDRITPDVTTASFAYYRFRNPPYSAEQMQEIAGRVRAHLEAGRDVFAYFKHEESPEGALFAETLRKLIG